jgi:oligopeptide transport system ATP-binding protein
VSASLEFAPLFQAQDLQVSFASRGLKINAVRGVSFAIMASQCVALVGESGSGKTQIFMAALGLLPNNASAQGAVYFAGSSLLQAHRVELNRIRGAALSMVFQDPSTALTPHLRIGTQMTEVLGAHAPRDAKQAWLAAEQMLDRVGVTEPARRLRQYPHQLSGGQRQRVLIGMGLMANPKLLIADEPTSALDVTTQAQIIELLRSLRRDSDMALALITHDLSVVAQLADRVLVMYAGRIVESGAAAEVLAAPRHPYTAELIRCMPRFSQPPAKRMPTIDGNPPRPEDAELGCSFAARCPRAAPRCRQERPLLSAIGQSLAACHFPVNS